MFTLVSTLEGCSTGVDPPPPPAPQTHTHTNPNPLRPTPSAPYKDEGGLLHLRLLLNGAGVDSSTSFHTFSTPPFGKYNKVSVSWYKAGNLLRGHELCTLCSKGLVINYGEGGGYKMGKSRVRNFLRHPLKTG